MEQSLKPLRFPLAALAVVVISACGRTPDAVQAPAAPKVSVAKVIEQPINEWDEFTGRLEAPETVEVRPRVSGQIDQVAFTEGAQVKKGDLLFQIDPRPFQAEVRRLEAQLQQAKATAIRSANEARRGERLRDSNAISAELAESRSSAAAEARAGVAAIQAQLDLARLNLSFTRVTAPISGRVSRAEFTAGNIVSADVTPLTWIVCSPAGISTGTVRRPKKLPSASTVTAPSCRGVENIHTTTDVFGPNPVPVTSASLPAHTTTPVVVSARGSSVVTFIAMPSPATVIVPGPSSVCAPTPLPSGPRAEPVPGSISGRSPASLRHS